MINFLPCRGTVFRLTTPDEGGKKGFALKPPIEGTEDSPILMQSVNINDSVVNMPVLTLNGVRILYVFGKAWGEISIGGLALLGAGGTGEALKKVTAWYEDNVVTNKEDGVSVSLVGPSYKFHVTGLSIGDPDTEHQFFPFSVQGKIIGLSSK